MLTGSSKTSGVNMCVIHLTVYSQCGHHIPDVQANIDARCDAVSAALVFYHEQPVYQPLDVPLLLPRSCKPIKRVSPNDAESTRQVQADWNAWMLHQFQLNGFGPQQRVELQRRALGGIELPAQATWIAYPDDQIKQYNALVEYQNRPYRAVNVVFKTVDGPCRRGSMPICEPPPPPSAAAPGPQAPSAQQPAVNTAPGAFTSLAAAQSSLYQPAVPTVTTSSSSLAPPESSTPGQEPARSTISEAGIDQPLAVESVRRTQSAIGLVRTADPLTERMGNISLAESSGAGSGDFPEEPGESSSLQEFADPRIQRRGA